jgi:hypothetical protein
VSVAGTMGTMGFVTRTFSFCLVLVGTFTDMMKYVAKTNDWGMR